MFCFLCQTGTVPKSLREKDFVWVHLDCVMELLDFRQDFKTVKKILAGNKNESVEEFLSRMYEFDKKWKRISKLVKDYEEGKIEIGVIKE